MGHLNRFLARRGGNLNKPIFRSSNARGLPGGGGRLNFRIDRRIIQRCPLWGGVHLREVSALQVSSFESVHLLGVIILKVANLVRCLSWNGAGLRPGSILEIHVCLSSKPF